jgi:hypothetical protein
MSVSRAGFVFKSLRENYYFKEVGYYSKSDILFADLAVKS